MAFVSGNGNDARKLTNQKLGKDALRHARVDVDGSKCHPHLQRGLSLTYESPILAFRRTSSSNPPHTQSRMTRVLLTGGSGFIAAHTLDVLLRHGHSVVTTVRSQDKADKIKEAYAKYAEKGQLGFTIVPDIAQPDAFEKAVISDPPFEAVLHTASPFHFNVTDVQKVGAGYCKASDSADWTRICLTPPSLVQRRYSSRSRRAHPQSSMSLLRHPLPQWSIQAKAFGQGTPIQKRTGTELRSKRRKRAR